MTADEREASIQRILQAVTNTVETVSEELQKATDVMEPGATHGAGIELLRGAPDLAELLGYTVPGLTAAANTACSRAATRRGKSPGPCRNAVERPNGDDRRDAHAQACPASGRLLS